MGRSGRRWLLVAAVSASIAAILGLDPGTRPLAAPATLAATAAVALLAELLAAYASTRSGRRAGPDHDPTPADGVVERVELAGFGGRANAVDPRWARFEPGPTAPGRPGVIAAGPSTLLGRVAVISIFVGTDGRPWTDDEVARGLGSVERAGAWLEREAIRRAAPLRVMMPATYFQAEVEPDGPVEIEFRPEGDDDGPLEAGATGKLLAMASRAASRLGFADAGDLMARVGPALDVDRRAWLLHVRRAGRSFAIPTWESGFDGVGLAVCYCREASFPEPIAGSARVDPTTVAHELLHLFAATDKYGVPLAAFPPGRVSRFEIMRLDYDRLARMRIDPMTAAEIGWDCQDGGQE